MVLAVIKVLGTESLRAQLISVESAGPHAAERCGAPLQPFAPLDGELNAALSAHHAEVDIFFEAGSELQRIFVQLGVALRTDGPRDDQRRPRLVHQNAVDLIDDREVQAAQHQFSKLGRASVQPFEPQPQLTSVTAHGDPVFQIVEGNLLVGHIRDVAAIRVASLVGVHAFLDHAHGESESAVEGDQTPRLVPPSISVTRC